MLTSQCHVTLYRLHTLLLRCSASTSGPKDVLKQLVVSLVITRLDYGNATLAGLRAYRLRQLQSVLNSGARLIFNTGIIEHVTPSSAIFITDAFTELRCATCLPGADLHRVTDVASRRLRSADTSCDSSAHSSVNHRRSSISGHRRKDV
jgi:hypothetical protein